MTVNYVGVFCVRRILLLLVMPSTLRAGHSSLRQRRGRIKREREKLKEIHKEE